MLLLYTPETSSRSDYIFDLLLTDILGAELRVTTLKDEFTGYPGPKINYSKTSMEQGIFIIPSGLLMENEIAPIDPEVTLINEVPVLFPVDDIHASLPFDIFSAAFFLVTRYEEYFPLKRDAEGRYRPEESLAHRCNFLHLPVINIWCGQLSGLLQLMCPGFVTVKPSFRFIPSIDIDHAYAYRQRGMFRGIGGFGRAVLKRRWKEVLLRIKVLFDLCSDPFDVYDELMELHTRHNLQSLYFILFADYGGNDNGVITNGRLFQQLLLKLDEQGTVGIHPSCASNTNFALLENETFGLSNYIGRDILVSRQHFIKLSFPDTYRRLIQVGITDDYSMGYASMPGFRAGIANPFPFYDLLSGTRTELKVHPFAFMDVTFRNYLKLDVHESLAQISRLVDAVHSVNGELISLWHNEALSEIEGWEGWRWLYGSFLDYVSKKSGRQ